MRLMPASSAMIFVSGWSRFHSPQVVVTTVACSSSTPRSRRGPLSASPVNVSKAERLPSSYMSLFERLSRPEVRSTRSSPR
jgi:hypothetical protein